jgi:hypothetical protein
MRRSTRVLGSWSTRSHSGRIGDSHRVFPCLTRWRMRRSFRFVWTKHLPTQSEVWGPSRRGFVTVQQTQFDDVTQMVKISDRRFVVAAPQDAIHGS